MTMHVHVHVHGMFQVAAQTGHSVYVVDLNKEILSKAEERIQTSLQRVAKKTFAEDPKVSFLADNTALL